MNKQMNELVAELKDNGQDFEFYPTTKDMVRTIWKYATDKERNDRASWTLLDIGCGTCNFKRWIEELNEEEREKKPEDDYRYRGRRVVLNEYYVIEKSRILIDRLEPNVIVLGTDFHETTLIDKPCDTIFCNPPYSEFEEWASRIITESVCQDIYLIVPERWKKSESIRRALRTLKSSLREHEGENRIVNVIGHADFLNAERSARAKVNILHIDKSWMDKDSGFDTMFDELFQMPDDPHDTINWAYDEEERKREALKQALLAGRNKVEILCNGYNEAKDELFNHFKTIAGLDTAVLESVGVHKKTVKEALKRKISGLKNLYWKAAFDCLDEITSRLTTTSRRNLLERFAILKSVDFTPSNLYAMIVWVIKNYNKFTEQQMIDLFCALSCPANVQNYVSNKRVFEEFHSRWGEKPRSTHYTLDYRIVCTEYSLPGEGWHSSYEPRVRDSCQRKIEDICAVAFSLGFKTGFIQMPETWGKRGTVYMDDYKTVLFAFRCYLNSNVHIKFNIELMKALNVAVARKLGWIRKPSDISQEFPPEMAKGAERYFDCFRLLEVSKVQVLICPPPEETDGNDCSGEEQEEIPLPFSI